MAIGDNDPVGTVPPQTLPPSRERLLRHMRPGQQPPPHQVRLARMQQAKVQLTQNIAQAKPLLDQAAPLVQDTAIAQPLRDAFTTTRGQFVAATQQNQLMLANQRLGEHKRAAVNLINGRKAADQRAQQRARQGELHTEMAGVFDSAKKASFPEGQAAYIGNLDLDAGKHFKSYLAALAAMEAAKVAAAKGSPHPPNDPATLKTLCVALINAAQAHLDHYDKDLSSSQQEDKASLTKKRYCESGRRTAQQYMLALEFDAVGDPRASPQGWDEAAQLRAATVRAKLNYHQAYEQAASLKEGGDSAGLSESLWLKGLDFTQDQNDEWQIDQNARVAIFKPFEGEKAAEGSSDKPGAGAVKEALASANAKLFAAQTGIDLRVPETNVVAVNRYAMKGADKSGQPLDEVIGSAQFNAGASKQINELPSDVRNKFSAKDVQKMAMLDIMQLNCDRHAGNIMVKGEGTANPEFVPIDHGGSMPTRADFGKMKNRIGGVENGASGVAIVNVLLTVPSAYEPFDAELLAQLDLLQPAEIEAAMRRQRDAMDQVFPSLDAGGKLPNDSLHLSKRSMMFMKRAARHLGPAEIQIALAQRGEALFDAPSDDAFNALADQVINDFIPMKDAYRELMTGPPDALRDVLDWLNTSGWVLPRKGGGDSSEDFLMNNPVLALKLYRAQTPNANPVQPMAAPQEPADPSDDPTVQAPGDAFRKPYMAEFPDARADVPDKTWKARRYFWQQVLNLGGFNGYASTVLAATGAKKDTSAKAVFDALTLWAELNQPANQALRAALRPTDTALAASVFLRIYLQDGYKAATIPATLNQAQATAQNVDDSAVQQGAIKDVLQRFATMASDPLLGPALQPLAPRVAKLKTGVTLKDWDRAHAMAEALDRDALAAALDALALLGKGEVDALWKQLPDRSLAPDLKMAADNLTTACYGKGSLSAAQSALSELRTKIAAYGRALTRLQAFSWDAKAASATKKAAIEAKYIADKDTGMSDALKAVADAQKAFDDVLGDKVKAEKKRPAGEKALAAYAKFALFVNSKLRPLSDKFEWKNYCAGGVKAASDKMAYIRGLMANWP